MGILLLVVRRFSALLRSVEDHPTGSSLYHPRGIRAGVEPLAVYIGIPQRFVTPDAGQGFAGISRCGNKSANLANPEIDFENTAILGRAANSFTDCQAHLKIIYS
ncbi:hypothetical protein [Tropicibacter alexandrii]|uniref:hypothetical protein n=1 Tax=Tropicibacter alexandrii TaxID=2267683 RepID=UPI00100932DE|nr:hypothetical protein [Tropicibacter alexandrii]